MGIVALCAMRAHKIYLDVNPVFEDVIDISKDSKYTVDHAVVQLAELVLQRRQATWSGARCAVKANTDNDITLMLVSLQQGMHKGTRFHFDWAGAENLLILVGEKPQVSSAWRVIQ